MFQDAWCYNKENPSAYWNATLSRPFMAQICKSVSRSDLVLDANHALDSLADLGLQACISVCSVSKRGLSPKGANWAQKGPFGGISVATPRVCGSEESAPINPNKASIGPEKGSN